MNQFPRHYGTCPEMQFSQTLLALDGCILFWWMRYLLRGSVFLHGRQEKLLFKIYLSMIGKHKTLHGFKFQVAGHCQKYQGIKARRHWVLIAGQRSPLLSLPPGSLNSWVIILKTALMETHVGDECQRLHWAGRKHSSSLHLHAFLHGPWSYERAFVYRQCLVFCHWLTFSWQSWETRYNPASAPSKNSLMNLDGLKSWRTMAHCWGYYSDWELSRNSCLKLLLQLLRKSCLPMVWETCIW